MDLYTTVTLASKTLLSSRNTSIRNYCSRVTCCLSRSEPAPPPARPPLLHFFTAGLSALHWQLVPRSEIATTTSTRPTPNKRIDYHGVGPHRTGIGLRRTEQCRVVLRGVHLRLPRAAEILSAVSQVLCRICLGGRDVLA